jgi:hypothetical protein
MKLETKENEFCEDRTAFTSKSLTESEIAWVARARLRFSIGVYKELGKSGDIYAIKEGICAA